MTFHFPVFEGHCASWESVLHLGRRVDYPRGALVLDMEVPADGVWYVKEGQLDTVLYTLEGPEKVIYAVGRGCLFGEACAFTTGLTGEATVWARTPCTLYFFRRETVEEVIAREHPALILEMVGLLGRIVRMYSVWLQDSLTLDYFQRVCRILVYFIHWKGAVPGPTGEVRIQADLAQNDLARLLGVHRVTVAKAVARLREEGVLLQFTRTLLHVVDYAGLCARAGLPEARRRTVGRAGMKP